MLDLLVVPLFWPPLALGERLGLDEEGIIGLLVLWWCFLTACVGVVAAVLGVFI